MKPQFARQFLPLFVFGASQLLVLGSAGQVRLDQLDVLAVHHVFHVVLPLTAFAIFAASVARDVGTHGWPTFSWRLDPTDGQH